jgi:hypothetical protein
MRRFWFEFETHEPEQLPPGVRMGCGATAATVEDALSLVAARVFSGADLPPLRRLTADIDISTLDAGHVLPNMGNPTHRGIWFPLGY